MLTRATQADFQAWVKYRNSPPSRLLGVDKGTIVGRVFDLPVLLIRSGTRLALFRVDQGGLILVKPRSTIYLMRTPHQEIGDFAAAERLVREGKAYKVVARDLFRAAFPDREEFYRAYYGMTPETRAVFKEIYRTIGLKGVSYLQDTPPFAGKATPLPEASPFAAGFLYQGRYFFVNVLRRAGRPLFQVFCFDRNPAGWERRLAGLVVERAEVIRRLGNRELERCRECRRDYSYKELWEEHARRSPQVLARMLRQEGVVCRGCLLKKDRDRVPEQEEMVSMGM